MFIARTVRSGTSSVRSGIATPAPTPFRSLAMSLLPELGLRLGGRGYKHDTPTELISRSFGGDVHRRRGRARLHQRPARLRPGQLRRSAMFIARTVRSGTSSVRSALAGARAVPLGWGAGGPDPKRCAWAKQLATRYQGVSNRVR